MALFSVVSIPALIPFLQILFKQKELVSEAPPLSLSLDSLTGNFNFWLSEIIRENGYERALLYMVGLIVVLFFGKNLFRYLSISTLAIVRSGIVRDLRNQLFGHVVTLPIGYFNAQRRGDLISRFTADVQEFESSGLNAVEALIQNPLLIVGALAVMLSISPSLTLFTILLLGLTGLIIGGISRRLRRQSGEVQEALGEMTSHIDEAIGGLRIVKGFSAEAYVSGRFRENNNRYRNTLVRLLRRRDLSSPLSEVLGIMVVSVLIYAGFQRIQSGALDVAVFIAFIYAFFSTIQPSKQFSNAFYSFQRGRAAFDRVKHVLDTPNPIQNKPNALPIPQLSEGLRFEKVSFSYPGADRPAS